MMWLKSTKVLSGKGFAALPTHSSASRAAGCTARMQLVQKQKRKPSVIGCVTEAQMFAL